jgi:hypothetical protein
VIRAVLLALLLCGALMTSAAPAPGPLAPEPHRRGEEQTFLTFPEWFLVFSPAEYAVFVRDHTPDQFVFWGHIRQFWQGYYAVTRETLARHNPKNWGYHLMIMVIGTSTSVEYAMRSAYETLIGRLAAMSASELTPEDRYAAKVAQDYVDFIRYRPWYEFDFTGSLRGLWSQTDLVGKNLLRKWERKYALTTEYSVKAIYGRLIGLATHSIYARPREVTSVALSRWPECQSSVSGIDTLIPTRGTTTLVAVPRYEGFIVPMVALARCGADFEEIAGNRTVILVSIIQPIGATPLAQSKLLMRQPILTQEGRERAVYEIPIPALGAALRSVADGTPPLTMEHIFDY